MNKNNNITNNNTNYTFDPIKDIKPEKLPAKELPSIAAISSSIHESKGLNNNKIIIIKDELLEELDKITLTKEEEIEQQIMVLMNNIDLTDASVLMEDIIQQYPYWGLMIENSGIEFLDLILPSQLQEIPYLEFSLEAIIKINHLAKIFLSATSNGAQLIAVICKEIILNHAKEILEKVKTDLIKKKSASKLKPQELAKVQKLLKQWEVNLVTERHKLKMKKIELGISSSIMTGFIGLEILKYAPLEQLSMASSVIGALTDAIITAEHAIIFALNVWRKRKFNGWDQQYRNWLSKHATVIDKGNLGVMNKERGNLSTTSNQLTQSSQDLLSKRQKVVQEKVQLIESQFDRMEPKIFEKNRIFYQQSIDQLFNHLNNLSTPPYIIEDLFAKLNLPSDSSTQDLVQTFKTYKNLVDSQAEPKEIQIAQKALAEEFDLWKKNEKNISNLLIRAYVDHHETIDHTIKNALKEIVQSKNILERKFFNFNLISSGITFKASLICLALSASIIIVGALTAPFWGMGFALLALSTAPIALSLGFIVAGCLLSLRKKPQTTKAMLKGLSAKIIWNRIRKAVSVYQHQNKIKKLKEVAKVLRQLHVSTKDKSDSTYQKILLEYEQVKAEWKAGEEKIDAWNKKLLKNQSIQWDKAWSDFTSSAGLSADLSVYSSLFDSLQALSNALKECDFQLMSSETKYLLETQMGINIELLQLEIQKNPEGFKTAFKQYAFLTEESLLNFIHKQENSIKAKMIPST